MSQQIKQKPFPEVKNVAKIQNNINKIADGIDRKLASFKKTSAEALEKLKNK